MQIGKGAILFPIFQQLPFEFFGVSYRLECFHHIFASCFPGKILNLKIWSGREDLSSDILLPKAIVYCNASQHGARPCNRNISADKAIRR